MQLRLRGDKSLTQAPPDAKSVEFVNTDGLLTLVVYLDRDGNPAYVAPGTKEAARYTSFFPDAVFIKPASTPPPR